MKIKKVYIYTEVVYIGINAIFPALIYSRHKMVIVIASHYILTL